MSYIIKNSEPSINLKLTDKGRSNLAFGQLNYVSYVLGDSEIDYTNQLPSQMILRPKDNQHDIIYPVPIRDNITKVDLPSVSAKPRVIYQSSTPRGFFEPSGDTYQPRQSICSIYDIRNHPNFSYSGDTFYNLDVAFNNHDTFVLNTGLTTILSVNDTLFVKFIDEELVDDYDETSLPPTFNHGAIKALFYKVTGLYDENDELVDSINLTGLTTFGIKVDRELPSRHEATIVSIYIVPFNIKELFDPEDPAQYWDEDLLSFNSTCDTTVADVPFWDFNIIYRENVIGLDAAIKKNKDEVLSKDYVGTYVSLKLFEQTDITKIGVVHYTNHLIDNYYAEGFYRNTLKLVIPHIMWHKKQFEGISTGTSLGYTFVCGTEIKFIDNKIRYYDLVDQEVNQTIVGKVLLDDKIIIIEHPELLTALSFKSDRNHTLPKPSLQLLDPGSCPQISSIGSLEPNQTMCVSYMLTTQNETHYNTSLHCEDYAKLTNTTDKNKDVLFYFDRSVSDNFAYLSTLYVDNPIKGYGYSYDNVYILWQIVNGDQIPDPTQWNIEDITRYLNTNGCLNSDPTVCEQVSLKTQVSVGAISGFTLSEYPIGDVLVFWNGNVLIPNNDYTISNKNVTFTGGLITGGTTVYSYLYGEGAVGTRLIRFELPEPGDELEFDSIVYTYPSGTDLTEYVATVLEATGSTNLVTLPNGQQAFSDNGSSTDGLSLVIPSTPNNDVVYVHYSGVLLDSSMYTLATDGITTWVRLDFAPADLTDIVIYYLDNSLGGSTLIPNSDKTPQALRAINVVIDKEFTDNSEGNYYVIANKFNLPNISTTGFTFGDEFIFPGIIETDIKSTIYKTSFNINILPNTYTTSNNPTFSTGDKVAFSELGIYDNQNNLVCIGKFSTPITRKYNADILTIEATIDF